MTKVALIGSPNVGKSVIFNYLTGTYVTVSNYPGTTVDVARGHSKISGKTYEVIDTPGLYSLIPLTEEERVTRELLFQEKPDIVVQVIDAKNIRRMLNMTLQLIDAGLAVILNINMMDEARNLGIWIDVKRLADILGIPVIATSAIKKVGLEDLKKAIRHYQVRPALVMNFSEKIEHSLESISAKLSCDCGLSRRMAAILLLQGDNILHNLIREEPNIREILADIDRLAEEYKHGMDYIITVERQNMVDKLLECAARYGKKQPKYIMDRLGRWTREPATGIPVLCLVLYLGLYQVVGRFGAGVLVDYFNEIFFRYINPLVENMAYYYIPWEWLQSMLVGEYGIFTLGFRYAVVIILPIVGTFFLVFAILEDCGYLPRLAMLVDRLFKYFGLNGRAVIPIVLGLGCGTMAVMVTRTLESRRERILATFLLSLTIPCSAQLGVVLALLSHSTLALAIWSICIFAAFIVAGWLSARILPGERNAFYLEIPPLRIPVLANVLTKAYTRMSWYFIEILPVFIVTSLVMWLGDRSGILPVMTDFLQPAMSFMGLPPETAQTFLLGFFRRDYGAAGLYDMCEAGVLADRQLLIAAVTLTLFVPCIAQMAVMIKERGLMVSIIMVTIIALLALGTGGLLNRFILAG